MKINSNCSNRTSEMPFRIEDVQSAMMALNSFRRYAVSRYHERYSFPFLCGSYFAYRKVDVTPYSSIARAISSNPRYLDVGCGYGDFLEKIRQYLPNARGSRKMPKFFMHVTEPKPDFIDVSNADWGIS